MIIAQNLYTAIAAVIAVTDVTEKTQQVESLWHSYQKGDYVRPTEADFIEIQLPGLPDALQLVHPTQVPRRRLGSQQGKVALLHAIAHIEFNAIHLALDAAFRFRQMPEAFYSDWLQVAYEEAQHFLMLNALLKQYGSEYGALPAHNGLWEAATKTAHDPLIRMALVPRVLEARGLDVTPGMIDKLRSQGELSAVECLEVILREEEGHVIIGNRWYQYLCKVRSVNPKDTFFALLEEYGNAPLQGPFNIPARRRAGFSDAELAKLLADAPF